MFICSQNPCQKMEPSQFMRVVYGLAKGHTRAKITIEEELMGKWQPTSFKNVEIDFVLLVPIRWCWFGDHTYRTVHRVKWEILFV